MLILIKFEVLKKVNGCGFRGVILKLIWKTNAFCEAYVYCVLDQTLVTEIVFSFTFRLVVYYNLQSQTKLQFLFYFIILYYITRSTNLWSYNHLHLGLLWIIKVQILCDEITTRNNPKTQTSLRPNQSLPKLSSHKHSITSFGVSRIPFTTQH